MPDEETPKSENKEESKSEKTVEAKTESDDTPVDLRSIAITFNKHIAEQKNENDSNSKTD